MQYHKYALTELENMMPWERDIYVTLLQLIILKKQNLKNQQNRELEGMDEEELEQPSSKINVGSFFERVDTVEEVANNG